MEGPVGHRLFGEPWDLGGFDGRAQRVLGGALELWERSGFAVKRHRGILKEFLEHRGGSSRVVWDRHLGCRGSVGVSGEGLLG